MSFQAYLDAVEKKTGLTPAELVDQAHEKGFGPGTKAGPILAWLAADHGLGRGHGMAMVHVITKGPQIADTHVGTDGVHRDESECSTCAGCALRGAAGARRGVLRGRCRRHTGPGSPDVLHRGPARRRHDGGTRACVRDDRSAVSDPGAGADRQTPSLTVAARRRLAPAAGRRRVLAMVAAVREPSRRPAEGSTPATTAPPATCGSADGRR